MLFLLKNCTLYIKRLGWEEQLPISSKESICNIVDPECRQNPPLLSNRY